MAGNIDDIIAGIDRASGDNIEASSVTIDVTDTNKDTADTSETSVEEGSTTTEAGVTQQPNQQQQANTQQQKNVPQQQDPKQQAKDTRPKADDKGNLVDANGNIIAAAGAQRRLHEQNTRLQNILQERDRELNELRVNNRAGEILNGIPKQYGMSNEETFEALKVAAYFKSNPVEAARIIVAEALKRGHNLEDILGEQHTGALNMSAIKGMLDERVAPLLREREEQQRAVQVQQEAQRSWNEFLSRYPDAEVNTDVLANMMREDPRQQNDHPIIVAERAYLRLEAYCHKHGLDISQPLGPQVQARQQQVPQVPVANQQRAPMQQMNAPMPSPSNTRGNLTAQRAAPVLSGSSSWREIIESVRADLSGGN